MDRKASSCCRQNKRIFSYVLNLCPECLADTYHKTSQTYSTLIVQILYLTSVPYALIPVALALLYTICLEGSSVYEEVCFTCRSSSNFLPWGFGVYFFVVFSKGPVRLGMLTQWITVLERSELYLFGFKPASTLVIWLKLMRDRLY